MSDRSFETGIDVELAERIRSAVRTSLGDILRTVVYFTPDAFDVVYTRRDRFDSDAAQNEAAARLVAPERTGFAEGPVRRAVAEREGGSDVGGYDFTVRVHEDGFVVRVIVGGAGVLFTTDDVDVEAFDDAVSAVRRLLADA